MLNLFVIFFFLIDKLGIWKGPYIDYTWGGGKVPWVALTIPTSLVSLYFSNTVVVKVSIMA
jgi:hypothetical protein